MTSRWIKSLATCLLLAGFSAQAQEPVEVEDFNPIPPDLNLPPPDRGTPLAGVDFRGVTAFSESKLREVLQDQLAGIKKSGLTAARADDTAFFLAVFYRKNGYAHARVEEDLQNGRLVLNVTEGPVTDVGDVLFTGNASIESETLKEYLLGTTTERLSRFDNTVPFIEGDILTGVERIRGLYASKGFLNVEVSAPDITFSPDKQNAQIHIKIEEGLQYTIGPVSVEGDLVFFPQNELKEQMEVFRKEPYTRTQVINMRRTVVYYYKTRGYFDTKIEMTADPALAEDGVVPVAFHVESGEIYRFDGVTTKGLDHLRESFLQRRFGKLSGQIYNPDVLNETFRKMLQTGLFTRLQISSTPLPSHEVRIDLKIEEAKSKEFGFSVGYGTFEGPFVGVSAGDRNLFGTGRPIRASVELSQRTYRGELLLRDPWFLETEYELTARLSALSTDFDGYSKFEVGGRLDLSREIAKDIRASLFTGSRNVSVTSTGIDPLVLGPPEYVVNRLGAALTFDHRDSLLNPRKGWIFTASTEYAGSALLGDVEFIRSTYRFSYYLPIGKSGKTLLAFGARGGVLWGAGTAGTIPIDERFFNGGSRSVRSFAERELGPHDASGFPIGGQSYSTYNIEYVFPIKGDLEGALFLDAGSVGAQGTDGFSDLRYGVGAGLRYRLPIGPLRLDYGWNPSRREDEAIGAFHFSFGFAF